MTTENQKQCVVVAVAARCV